jgi:hypothetical protein
MTAKAPSPNGISAASYDQIVDAHNLALLKVSEDWSLENGDLATTKDGDIKVGDDAYNGLFRLVQTWRYSEPHLRYLFDTMNEMVAWRDELGDKFNALGEEKMANFSIDAYGKPDAEFAAAFRSLSEEEAVSTFGAVTYSGSLMLMLSSALLRLKDDINAKDDWNKTEPFFNSYSVGSIITAAANGFRHADEWAKTRIPTSQQKASQDVINGALYGFPPPNESSPGRCVEVLQLVSGGDFTGLASKIFTFSHNLALKARVKSQR